MKNSKLLCFALLGIFLLGSCYPESEHGPDLRLEMDLGSLALGLDTTDIQAWIDWHDQDLAQFDMNQDGNFFLSLGLVDADGGSRDFTGFGISYSTEDGDHFVLELGLDECDDCHFEALMYWSPPGADFVCAQGSSDPFSVPESIDLDFSIQRLAQGQISVTTDTERLGRMALFDFELLLRLPMVELAPLAAAPGSQALFEQVPVGREFDLQWDAGDGQGWTTIQKIQVDQAGQVVPVNLP
ncbi:MAG: hypothetical protein JRF33_22520 [Deltaproteobacteria bacterium]|nr:hypothetical protein [Deltaproteobacteria bacterium]